MKELMTTKEAAKFCGLDASSFRRYRMERTGPAVHQLSQRTFRYAEEDLLAWLASRRVLPARASMEEAVAAL